MDEFASQPCFQGCRTFRDDFLRVTTMYLDPGCPTFLGVYILQMYGTLPPKRKDIQGPGRDLKPSLNPSPSTDQVGDIDIRRQRRLHLSCMALLPTPTHRHYKLVALNLASSGPTSRDVSVTHCASAVFETGVISNLVTRGTMEVLAEARP